MVPAKEKREEEHEKCTYVRERKTKNAEILVTKTKTMVKVYKGWNAELCKREKELENRGYDSTEGAGNIYKSRGL